MFFKIFNVIFNVYTTKRDKITLARRYPWISNFLNSENMLSLATELKNSYHKYMLNTNRDDAPISFRLACFIYFCLLNLKPRSILDLGSGYSSFVFRYYQKKLDKNINIISVDDNEIYLNKTINFILDNNLSSENIVSLEKFYPLVNNVKFDFIFLDLTTFEDRLEFIEKYLPSLNNGWLILDDTHKVRYLRRVKKIVKKHKYKLFNLYDYTVDYYNRYSSLILRK